jgi:predicted MFS family arabinose efflux permease
VSSVGTSLSGIGVAVFVFVETGSAAWLGVLTAVAALPYLLTGPLMPRLDRYPRRTAMIVADSLAALGTLVAFALALSGRLEVWHLVVAGFVGGVGNSLQFPAFQAAIPALVSDEALGRANGLNQLGPALGIVIGPVVATPLVAWHGIRAVLVVDLATFAFAVVTTAIVRFGPAGDPLRSGVEMGDDGSWRTAFTWLRTEGRPVLGLLGAIATVNFCLAFFNISMLALATDVAGTARAGLVFGAAGVAMIVGSLAVGIRGVPTRRVRTFSLALTAMGIGCAVAASRATFGVLAVGSVIALVMVPIVNAAVATIYHERVPPTMQGRVFGLRSAIGHSLEPLGSVVAGFLIARVAVPAMAEGGVGAATIGPMIGVGPERGAALVLLGVGGTLLGVGIWLGRSWIGGEIDEGAAHVTGV